MASKAKVECSLNTTECILETITSILIEIREQNNEYNWDPLTFVFTAIIGIIAILVAGLAAFQAFLAAGPGRTKSGAYAIGPWSQLNRRKFDLTEMRFRTTSSTPIITMYSLNYSALRLECSLSSDQDPARLGKGEDEYFPATWLALLSHLSLDKTKLWDQVKITGADFIPSELSAVPAYGSIIFVVTLAMILSGGRGHLTVDQESGLPRVRYRYFNLIFRQHPLLGIIGFFEMYGEEPFRSRWHVEIYKRVLQAHGYLGIPDPRYGGIINTSISMDQEFSFVPCEGDDYMIQIADEIEERCPHTNQAPKPACLNVHDYVRDHINHFLFYGPFCLSTVSVPDLLPYFFPHKKARLRERLDTLLLQSRFWGIRSTAYCGLPPKLSANGADFRLQLINAAMSWARSSIRSDIDELKLRERDYKDCSAYLDKDAEVGRERMPNRWGVRDELRSLDSWLKQIEPYALCRIITLGFIGDGIRQMIDPVEQQPILEASSGAKNATVPSYLDGILLPILHDKLGHLLEAISKPNSSKRLRYGSEEIAQTMRHDMSEHLRKIQDLWEMEELHLNDVVSMSGDGADGGQEHDRHVWKLTSATFHPLDNVLIYRAVLMTILYCLSSDSSDVIENDAWDIIVPIA
ncbi:uncharacterized protein B0J16DRAFT_388151 [Fusarium flagelliforme]|uniref:Uncharacterized protein n=1 Tax=Fusarium flagelliforme TaxID=2675880 RepID=A0A395MZB8_9HYPO|nr:uncharacterized protein B0J16DRAFT_388151 [Fusarium flagelliforme]KAH7174333.1 hypothetical protein B0J16DRAFT_388151 [Fusarium flagelliforme]RFN53258.1 hypothetical protein FIE12Z_2477 [Fusarium flagelliforme]